MSDNDPDRPPMHEVDSSSVEVIGYDEANRELYVRFHDSGETYVYSFVSREAFKELEAAESKGRYVNSEIKPKHPYRKLDAAD
jgi:hypothetical protein